MGAGGISITSISFAVPRANYKPLRTVRAPEVQLILTTKDGGSIKTPKFWLDSRQMSSTSVTFTAYDRLAFADGTALTAHDVGADVADKKIAAAEVVDIIASKLGLDAWVNKDGCFDALEPYLPAELVGESCSAILNDMASALMGFWCVNNNNELVFCAWYQSIDVITYNCKDCTAPDIGDTLTVTEYTATDGSGNEWSYEAGVGGIILQADGARITSKAAAELVGKNNCNRQYTYGSVSKAVIDHIPELNTAYRCGDDAELVINNISATISTVGIIAQLSANNTGGSEIGTSLGEISRKLQRTIKIGEKDGSNVIHTRYQGDIQVDSAEYEQYKKSQGGSG